MKSKIFAGVAGLTWLGFVFLIASLCYGCGARVKNVTELPANVTQAQAQSYDTAVANLHKISSVVSSMRSGIVDERVAGGFPNDAAYGKVLQSLGKIDGIEFDAASYLETVPNKILGADQKTRLQGYISAIQAELTKLTNSGDLGIKNATSQTNFNNGITELVGIANLIFSLTN